MPTGVSLFVLLPEERAKWVEYAGQAGPRYPQRGQGPKTVKAGTRTLYRREDVEQWLAEVDRRSEPMGGRKNARSEPTPAGPSAGTRKLSRLRAGSSQPTRLHGSSRAPMPCCPSPKAFSHNSRQGSQVRTQREMTRMSVGTLPWWRAVGEDGPASFKLGRRVMYRRTDVEKWLGEAQ
jgi:hypothetical protein